MQDFVTLTDLEGYLEVDSVPTFCQLYLDAAMASVRGYLDQEITLHLDDVEFHDGKGQAEIRLRERPVRRVTELKVDDVVVDPSLYVVQRSVIRLLRGKTFNQSNFLGVNPMGVANIQVTYDHGWDVRDDETSESSGEDSELDELTIPADIVLVALSVSRRALMTAGQRDDTMKSEKIGDYLYQVEPPNLLPRIGLIDAEQDTLDNYRIGSRQ